MIIFRKSNNLTVAPLQEQLAIVCLQTEIGTLALATTTLQSLGIVKGSALLRLIVDTKSVPALTNATITVDTNNTAISTSNTETSPALVAAQQEILALKAQMRLMEQHQRSQAAVAVVPLLSV